MYYYSLISVLHKLEIHFQFISPYNSIIYVYVFKECINYCTDGYSQKL